MFINFFHVLKGEGVPVSFYEWMTLMEALAKGLAFSSLTGFYYLARAVLVKNEAHFDRYDLAFARYFKGVETPADILEKALAWLDNPVPAMMIALKKQSPFAQFDLLEMRRQLEDRLKNQHGQHQDGPTRIGTGGTSMFGHSGENPAGIRIGGESANLSAVKVAAERIYRGYRNDSITGVRQYEMALRRLRQLSTRYEGPRDELDLNGTIDATCRNAGMLKLVWERPRRNKFKIILLMDSGGSMDRYMQICSRLFTAANRTTHFKEIKFYYFHNCVYENIYTSHFISEDKAIKTEEFLKKFNSDYRLIIVGDASMSKSEMLLPGGAIAWNEFNKEPGQIWLKRLAKHFPHSVWLNPVPLNDWDKHRGRITISITKDIFSMYELTPEGLEQALKKIKR